MNARTRFRIVVTAALVMGAGSLLAAFPAGGEFATFSAETENASSQFAGGWVDNPTPLTAIPAGYGAAFTWTPGTHAVTGQQLWGVDGGTGGSAGCGTYALTATMAGPGTAAYTDAGASGHNGHWWCYEMVSTSGTAWTSSATFTALRVGLIVTSVVVSNGGTNGTMDSGDRITITFNQNINTPTANRFCAVNNGTSDVIYIGDTRASGSTCATGDTYTIGTITGVTISGTITARNETVTMTAGNVVRVQLTQSSVRTAAFASPVFTPSASVTSVTGPAVACTSALAPTCTVVPTGGF